MGVRDPEIRLQKTYSLRTERDTPYIAVSPDFFEALGIDPAENPEELPDELTTEYVKQGRDEGTFEIDLKSQVEEANDGA